MQARAVRRSIDELEATSRQTLERFGLEVKPRAAPGSAADAVIDVGGANKTSRLPVVLKKGLQSVMLATSFALLGFAMLALGMFTAAAALAFVVITRGLGLRVDVNRPAAT